MKGLTIKQPWPYAIFHLDKNIENRDWDTNFRGRIAVHASKNVRKSEFDLSVHAIGSMVDYEACVPPQEYLPHGMIVGLVDIVDCVDMSYSPWFVGDFGFVLENAVELPRPIAATGALGFWTVPDDIEQEILRQISEMEGQHGS